MPPAEGLCHEGHDHHAAWGWRCLLSLQAVDGCSSGHPQQKCRVDGATAISLFILEAPWVPPPQSLLCRRAGLCHPPVSMSVSVSTPALQHSQPGPPPLLEGRAAPVLKLHPATWGLRRTEESRPALTSQVGLGSDWSHQPRQQGPGFLMKAAPSLEVHHPVEQRSHHPDIIHNLPILQGTKTRQYKG